MPNLYASLNQQKALIWRIIHRDNLPWVLGNGLHCGNSAVLAPNWVSIGNPELTDRRATHPVQLPPGGCLNDYVPFYFTPFSPMLLNIKTGRGGVTQRSNEEIVILVSSLHRVAADPTLRWLFTDSHAYYQWANYYSSLDHLDKIDWPVLQSRNFTRDPDDPARFERYQAEALVHQYMPVSALLGVVCYTLSLKQRIEQEVAERGLRIDVHARPTWYF